MACCSFLNPLISPLARVSFGMGCPFVVEAPYTLVSLVFLDIFHLLRTRLSDVLRQLKDQRLDFSACFLQPLHVSPALMCGSPKSKQLPIDFTLGNLTLEQMRTNVLLVQQRKDFFSHACTAIDVVQHQCGS